ncbi:MAG: DUF1844 domain-containing protein [Candidatus Omnitrophica bacterium]|nr:DUF1844 domain-containing protein [Candidatus Omnitrophota bacterium]
MSEEIKKNVDESWKEEAEKEKSGLKDQSGFMPPQPDFNFFITTLGLQASIFLGVVVSPETKQKEENLPQAKFIIDTLTMLKEKTQGNLKKEEAQLLENILYELQVQYVSKTRNPEGDNK